MFWGRNIMGVAKDVYSPYFNSTEKQLIYSAVEEAAEYLRRYYCFSSREWFNHCYDVRTAHEVQLESLSRRALAEVKKYISFRHDASHYPKDRYHICLFDNNILGALRKQSGLEFYPFMVYILTHELVHVARFCQDLHPFECDEKGIEQEEEKVNSLTRKVLDAKKSKTFYRISTIHQKITAPGSSPAGSIFA
jgi:hypothetical protein